MEDPFWRTGGGRWTRRGIRRRQSGCTGTKLVADDDYRRRCARGHVSPATHQAIMTPRSVHAWSRFIACTGEACLARPAFACVVLLVTIASLPGRAAGEEGKLRYRRDILPLLSD